MYRDQAPLLSYYAESEDQQSVSGKSSASVYRRARANNTTHKIAIPLMRSVTPSQGRRARVDCCKKVVSEFDLDGFPICPFHGRQAVNERKWMVDARNFLANFFTRIQLVLAKQPSVTALTRKRVAAGFLLALLLLIIGWVVYPGEHRLVIPIRSETGTTETERSGPPVIATLPVLAASALLTPNTCSREISEASEKCERQRMAESRALRESCENAKAHSRREGVEEERERGEDKIGMLNKAHAAEIERLRSLASSKSWWEGIWTKGSPSVRYEVNLDSGLAGAAAALVVVLLGWVHRLRKALKRLEVENEEISDKNKILSADLARKQEILQQVLGVLADQKAALLGDRLPECFHLEDDDEQHVKQSVGESPVSSLAVDGLIDPIWHDSPRKSQRANRPVKDPVRDSLEEPADLQYEGMSSEGRLSYDEGHPLSARQRRSNAEISFTPLIADYSLHGGKENGLSFRSVSAVTKHLSRTDKGRQSSGRVSRSFGTTSSA